MRVEFGFKSRIRQGGKKVERKFTVYRIVPPNIAPPNGTLSIISEFLQTKYLLWILVMTGY